MASHTSAVPEYYMLAKLNNSSCQKLKRTEWVCYSGANRCYIVTSLTKCYQQHYSTFKEVLSSQNSVDGLRVNNIYIGVYTQSIGNVSSVYYIQLVGYNK